MPGPANSLNISQPGVVVFDGVSNFLGRTLTAGTGISITNGTGISGNPVISATSMTTTPFVSAYRSTTVTNFTGDGTDATVIFDAETADATGSYNAATGIFTAPVAGNYQITATVTYASVDSTFTLGNLQIKTSDAGITQMFTTCNPGKLFNVNNNYSATVTANVGIVAGTTVTINTQLSGGTKTVGISGTGFGVFTYLNISYSRP